MVEFINIISILKDRICCSEFKSVTISAIFLFLQSCVDQLSSFLFGRHGWQVNRINFKFEPSLLQHTTEPTKRGDLSHTIGCYKVLSCLLIFTHSKLMHGVTKFFKKILASTCEWARLTLLKDCRYFCAWSLIDTSCSAFLTALFNLSNYFFVFLMDLLGLGLNSSIVFWTFISSTSLKNNL